MKAAHIVNDCGVINVRRPYTKTGKYNSAKQFMSHEHSQFFDYALQGIDYVEVTGRGQGRDLDDVIQWGTTMARQGLRFDGKTYSFLYGHFTNHLSIILVDSSSGIKTIDDLGVTVVNANKAPKYMKRLKAPYEYAVFGENLDIDTLSDGSTIQRFKLTNGYIGNTRFINLEDKSPEYIACVDGHMRVKTDFLRVIGVKSNNLSAYGGKGSVFTGPGFGKGYALAQDDLQYDIVVYGPKESIKYDRFMFGILGEMNPGFNVNSDIQSLINFNQYKWVLPAATKFIDDLRERIGDEEGLREFVLKHMGRNVPESVDFDANTWSLVNAMRVGMDIHAEPGLFRKVVQHLMFKTLDFQNGRIPFDQYAVRADICPDPNMFDQWGDLHMENTVIPTGAMICMDAPQGLTVEYRMPNGHALEHSRSVNIHDKRFTMYEGKHRSFYGADLRIVNAPKNGADLDDSQVVVFDQEMVADIRKLFYPVLDKVSDFVPAAKPISLVQSRVDELNLGSFNISHFVRMMSSANNLSSTIGVVVNGIMMDTCLSGAHKEHMLNELDARIQRVSDLYIKELLQDARIWLKNKPDYYLNDVATNLEAIIDYCHQRKGSEKQFKEWVDKVNKFRNEAMVYPELFVKTGRLPSKKIENVNFVSLPSLLDEQLDLVADKVQDMFEELKLAEWSCITPVPFELEVRFPHSQGISEQAKDLRKWWNTEIIATMSVSGKENRKRAYNELLRGKFENGVLVKDGLIQWINQFEDKELQMDIAVELKRICHRFQNPVFNDNGTVRSVPDSVFSNDVIFNLYLNALEYAGLTGKYITADLTIDAYEYRNGIHEVDIENGNIMLHDSGEWIGTLPGNDPVENGTYKMRSGKVEYKLPDPSITKAANYLINEEDDNFIEIEN